MAKKSADILSSRINKTIAEQYSITQLKNAFTRASIELVEVMRDRTSAGIDVNSKRLKGYKRSYREFKKRYIDGKVKYRTRKKTVKRSTALRYRDLQDTTRFKARKLPNHGRLTGKTFSSWKALTPKVTRNSQGLRVIWGVEIKGIRNNRVNEFLNLMGRSIFGLAKKNPRRQNELNRCYKAAGLPIKQTRSL